jgi:hypothetical protein
MQPDIQAQEVDQYEGVRRTALEIAGRQREQLRKIKQTLVQGDRDGALQLMSAFLGVTDDDSKEGNRTNPRLN